MFGVKKGLQLTSKKRPIVVVKSSLSTPKIDKGKSPKDPKLTPFLKWAGGKRWLVQSQSGLFPRAFNTYIEPFLGSAAVYFHLQPEKALLSDLNADLILTYKWIKEDSGKIEKLLQVHHNSHNETYYYAQRATDPRGGAQRAARFIYLNRTCWNGLYRVNLRGKFNVPIGTKTDVVLDSDNFPKISRVLKSATLKVQDFEKSINSAKEGDLIFADPPYTVAHNNNGFIKYNQHLFSWEDQIRLKAALLRAGERGAKFILLNANHSSLRDLYKDFTITVASRMSVLAADRSYRNLTEEIAVKNF